MNNVNNELFTDDNVIDTEPSISSAGSVGSPTLG